MAGMLGRGEWSWGAGLNVSRPFHLPNLSPVARERSGRLCAPRATKIEQTDSARMSLCDIWADTGLRVGKLRDPRPFALMGFPLCMSHIGHPHWGGLRGESHPPHITMMSVVSSEVGLLAGCGDGLSGSRITAASSPFV